MTSADRIRGYETRREQFEAHSRQQTRRSRRVSIARLVTFLAAAVLAIGAYDELAIWRLPLLIAAAALLVAFVVLVAAHSRIDRLSRWFSALAGENSIAIARLRRDWDGLPAAEEHADSDHPFASDLDVLGRASLLQWLAPATNPGRRIVRDWLLAAATPEEIEARQIALRELAPAEDFRQHVAAYGRLSAESSEGFDRFVRWSEGEPWLLRRPALVWVARVSTAAAAGLAFAHATGAIEQALWAVPIALNLLLLGVLSARSSTAFDRASRGERGARAYADLLGCVCRHDVQAPLLRSIRGRLTVRGHDAHVALRGLSRILELADFRHAAPLIAVPVNALTLWDVHVWSALERWQQQYGPHVRDWLHAAGEVDALCTFAGVVHDNPGWTFPSVSAEGPLRLEARGIGHPLLRDEVRVGNDVSLGPPGTFLLLTGSNMSGKSTLLRSIGLNVVLAQAGAPCCASALSLPPVRLYTSMRVQDSLEQGLSYFMAALARLKLVVEAASAQSPAPLLYLLDEVLQGTNTAERQIAVREILMHLLERTAFGAVTTHDLALADTPALAGVAQFLHFTEHVSEKEGRVSLSFDYKLRPGIATSTNALMLMKLMGLRS